MPRPVRKRNRTSVLFRAVRLGLRLLASVSPNLAAALVERGFFTPPRSRPKAGEALLRRGRRFNVRSEGRRVVGWRLGTGPMVVLVHGWGGSSAQLALFVDPLLKRGFSVVAFDAPGHGRSARGLSSAPEFARALRAVAGAECHAIVAHSLGAAAAALALRDGLLARRVVLVNPVADPPRWARALLSRLDLPADVSERVRARSERRIGVAWDEIHVPALVGAMTAKALVFHDRDDRQVPIADGEAIVAAWPGAALVETSGLGHNRGLSDPGLVARATAFLTEGPEVCACGAWPTSAGRCEACLLEAELFHPDRRWGGEASPPSGFSGATMGADVGGESRVEAS